MQVKTRKIVGRIAELGLSGDYVARAIGVNPATYYRKMACGGGKFTVDQVQAMIVTLQFTKSEAISIFFADELADTQEKPEGIQKGEMTHERIDEDQL